MNEWYEMNSHNPYPTDDDKQELAEQGGIFFSV